MNKAQLGIAVAAAFVIGSGVSAVAAQRFDDVPEDHAFSEAIAWAADNGITAGCDDQGNFCPSAFTTRAQMVEFLYRLSGDDPDAPNVVDADTVDGLDATELRGQTGPPGAPGEDGDDGDDGDPGKDGQDAGAVIEWVSITENAANPTAPEVHGSDAFVEFQVNMATLNEASAVFEGDLTDCAIVGYFAEIPGNLMYWVDLQDASYNSTSDETTLLARISDASGNSVSFVSFISSFRIGVQITCAPPLDPVAT